MCLIFPFQANSLKKEDVFSDKDDSSDNEEDAQSLEKENHKQVKKTLGLTKC